MTAELVSLVAMAMARGLAREPSYTSTLTGVWTYVCLGGKGGYVGGKSWMVEGIEEESSSSEANISGDGSSTGGGTKS